MMMMIGFVLQILFSVKNIKDMILKSPIPLCKTNPNVLGYQIQLTLGWSDVINWYVFLHFTWYIWSFPNVDYNFVALNGCDQATFFLF